MSEGLIYWSFLLLFPCGYVFFAVVNLVFREECENYGHCFYKTKRSGFDCPRCGERIFYVG